MDIGALITAAFTDGVVLAFAYTAGALILADAFIGAFKANQDGSFKLEWLYAFTKTKGAIYVQILALYIVAKAVPNTGPGEPGDPSSVNLLALFASTEGAAFIGSLTSSLKGNFLGKDRGQPPEGVTIPAIPVIEPPIEPIAGDEEGGSH